MNEQPKQPLQTVDDSDNPFINQGMSGEYSDELPSSEKSKEEKGDGPVQEKPQEAQDDKDTVGAGREEEKSENESAEKKEESSDEKDEGSPEKHEAKDEETKESADLPEDVSIARYIGKCVRTGKDKYFYKNNQYLAKDIPAGVELEKPRT